MRHAIVVCVSIVLSLPAAEHVEQLCPESFAHEKVQEEIGDVVEIEEEMSEIRGNLSTNDQRIRPGIRPGLSNWLLP